MSNGLRTVQISFNSFLHLTKVIALSSVNHLEQHIQSRMPWGRNIHNKFQHCCFWVDLCLHDSKFMDVYCSVYRPIEGGLRNTQYCMVQIRQIVGYWVRKVIFVLTETLQHALSGTGEQLFCKQMRDYVYSKI